MKVTSWKHTRMLERIYFFLSLDQQKRKIVYIQEIYIYIYMYVSICIYEYIKIHLEI